LIFRVDFMLQAIGNISDKDFFFFL
jgi:hypothetical protein